MRRRPTGVVVHHSDQGCQYTSYDFARACRRAGVERSMGSVGDCYDNALAESFFATLECELLDRTVFESRNDARLGIFDFIESFYNPWRRHSSIGDLSPVEFERRWQPSPTHATLPDPSSEVSARPGSLQPDTPRWLSVNRNGPSFFDRRNMKPMVSP